MWPPTPVAAGFQLKINWNGNSHVHLPCLLTLKCVHRYSSSQVTSDYISRSETCRRDFFEIKIPCILLFLNRNKNSQNNPKIMHPKFS